MTLWFNDDQKVLKLAHWLVDNEKITTIEELLLYFEKPFKWEPEYHHLKSIGEIE